MFERGTIQLLAARKADVNRKPLVIHGARQVSKTQALKYFSQKYFEDVVYFSLDRDESRLYSIFKTTKDPERTMQRLSFLHGRRINPWTTLLILDEAQECNETLNSLKYFCEEAPEYAVACAGSLLGIHLNHIGNSFPVGKVNHLSMYPLTSTGFPNTKDPAMYQYMCPVKEIASLPQILFDKLWEVLIAYSICGGMLEPTSLMVGSNDIQKVDSSLRDILNDYALDFVKHATPILTPRAGYVWNSLPSQLAKESRKFVYQLVHSRARTREYEDAILWLEQVNFVSKVVLSKSPRLPPKAYNDLNTFKLYASDIGLLRQSSELGTSVLLLFTPGYTECRGTLAENYVLQGLTAQFQASFCYWTPGNRVEADFLLQYGNHIYPMKVKADQNITDKSLAQYEKPYQPACRTRCSMLNLRQNGNLINIPLSLTDKTKELLNNNVG